MYGLAGERRLPELELDWLPGYEGSRRCGSATRAARQLQLDVYGEVHRRAATRRAGAGLHAGRRRLGAAARACSTSSRPDWHEPDEGIWEVRGPRRHFAHSKVMAWVAFDRAVKAVERVRRSTAPLDRWRALRDEIHAEVCAKGYDPEREHLHPVLRLAPSSTRACC